MKGGLYIPPNGGSPIGVRAVCMRFNEGGALYPPELGKPLGVRQSAA